MKQDALVLAILLSVSITVLGQDAIRVGDEVTFSCTRMTSGWCSGRVEAVNGNNVRIKWGNTRDQFSVVARDQVRVPTKPDSAEATAFKEAFAAEVGTNQRNALRIFAHFYAPDEFFNSRGTPTTAAGWTDLMARLAEVDAMCKGKYRGMTNRTPSVAWPGPKKGDLDARYGEWCRIADQRQALESRVRSDAAKYMLSPNSVIIDIKKAIEHSQNLVWDQEQEVLFEPTKYKAKTAADLKKSFAEYGTPMPADSFDELDKHAAELKAVIDRTAPTRNFTKPPFQDAAAQSAVKQAFVAKYPGSQIVRIGSRYPKWEKRTGADLTGMGTGYKLYTLTTNFYKAGDMLVKMPNRPYCQMRSWTVRQTGMVAILGEAGEFMKCE